MQVKLQVENQQNASLFSRKWKLGSCYGPRDTVTVSKNWISVKEVEYWNSEVAYLDRCCLRPGIHILTCVNDKSSFGWGDSFIEIQGQRYCDDFVGAKVFRRVFISGRRLIIHTSLSGINKRMYDYV